MQVQVLVESEPLDRPYLIKVPGITEAQFDELSTEDSPYELLDGVLIVHSPASLDHEDLNGFLLVLLRAYVSEKDLGMVYGSRAVLRLQAGRKVEPDLFFLSHERTPAAAATEVQGTADLVVEILSRSTRSYDLGEKRLAYRDAGTGETWFVDRDRRLVIQEVRTGSGSRTRTLRRGRIRSRAVAGFWLDLDWLWKARLPRPLACLERILGGPASRR